MFYEPATKTVHPNVLSFRQAHSNTSFGELDTEHERNLFGLFTLVDQPPVYDGKLTRLEKGEITQLSGVYTQIYKVVDLNLPREEKARIFAVRLEHKAYDHYDEVARQRGYDHRDSVLKRAGYPNRYREEAEKFGKWMGECDEQIYRIINEITGGTREIPFGPEFFIRGLPSFEWPKG